MVCDSISKCSILSPTHAKVHNHPNSLLTTRYFNIPIILITIRVRRFPIISIDKPLLDSIYPRVSQHEHWSRVTSRDSIRLSNAKLRPWIDHVLYPLSWLFIRFINNSSTALNPGVFCSAGDITIIAFIWTWRKRSQVGPCWAYHRSQPSELAHVWFITSNSQWIIQNRCESHMARGHANSCILSTLLTTCRRLAGNET
jgi:hypothetical protein